MAVQDARALDQNGIRDRARAILTDEVVDVQEGGAPPPLDLCGREYLAIQITGPYSTSVVAFWVAGPGTNFAFVGPFFTLVTLHVWPGTYTIAIPGEGNHQVNVPECGYGTFTYRVVGWGEPVP